MLFDLVLTAAAILAGALASVAGFGIGSILTPIVAMRVDTRLAVAAVSIPHLIGTAARLWLFAGHLDRRIFVTFGLTSAAGGLAGALLHNFASNRALGIVFGCILWFVGLSELTGLMRRVRFGRKAAWLAGAVSGLFGGLVGNQGGIRSAALLAFETRRDTFVQTATAIGLVVDGARMPLYLVTEASALLGIWKLIAYAVAGVLIGTLAGKRLLQHLPHALFRSVVAALLLALGTWMVVHG